MNDINLNVHKNHNAVQMEPDGMMHAFRRSEQQCHLKYTGYLGDGESKSYSAVAHADPPVYMQI